MRIRQIKPEFWRDEPLSRLSDGARLFYIGLWQLADDGGWLEWNVPEVGAELYRFRSRRTREAMVERYAAELSQLNGAGRLLRESCGHAFLPHLVEHQRFGGRLSVAVTTTHVRDCARLSATVRHGREGIGTVEVEVSQGKLVRMSAKERTVLVVACAECGVDAGEPCRGVRPLRNGDEWERWAVHRSRWQVYQGVESLSIEQVRSAIDDPMTSPAARKAYERALSQLESRL